MALLTLESVRAGYGAADVVDIARLEVQPGSLTVVLGANGAGKSTLLRAISGVVRARTGRIIWGTSRIEARSPSQVARLGIAHVPEGRGIFPDLTVEETLRIGMYGSGAGRRGGAAFADARDRIFVIFPRLAERRRQAASTLSGGEQQMLAIARALVAEPELLMLDEPSLGLSPRIAEEVFSRLETLPGGDRAVLLVEQNARAALSIATHAYVITRGRVGLQGKPSELAHSDEMRYAYLGVD